MPIDVDRRTVVLGSMAIGVSSSILGSDRGVARSPYSLAIERRQIEVNGQQASVFGIRQPDGSAGLTLRSSENFAVRLSNRTAEETIIHWHGQLPPYEQDGVADRNVPLIKSGAERDFNYVATPGTHWMHSHHGLQKQALMAAPLVVRSSDDEREDSDEFTILLHDFSFRDAEEILADLTSKRRNDMMGMNHSNMKGMDHSSMASGSAEMAMPMDLNDVEYDAFLVNDRTLRDPWILKVESRARIRLRIINGAASTGFWIDLGDQVGSLLSVDGNLVQTVRANRFPLAPGQRIDVQLLLPPEGAFPILAQVEGTRRQTGLILATPRASVSKISEVAEDDTPAVDLSLEMKLRAVQPLASRQTDQTLSMRLTGSMTPYTWSIGGQMWPNVDRPVVRQGQRMAVTLVNTTMMAHPMHLHGHHFQVTALNGSRLSGALRDTVLVPAMGSVEIAFDAINPGRWPFHCHNLYHMHTGMMTEFVYDSFA